MSLTGRERYRPNTQDLSWTEEQARERENVGSGERLASGVVGGALLVGGLLRPRWPGMALVTLGSVLLHRGMTGHCVVYEAMGANTNAIGRRKVPTNQAVKVDERIRIARPAEELYRFWRNLTNLPRILPHLESVEPITGKLSHWVARTDGGPRVEWDAEIINEIDGELIGWRSLAGSDVQHAGSVHFTRQPDGRTTEMRVVLQYYPPSGLAGVMFAKALGQDPARLIAEDLRRFKDEMEKPQGAKRV